MSRNIISKRQIGALVNPPTPQTDEYVSKIIKLIPAEIISVYLAVFNIVDSSSKQAEGINNLQWVVFILILAITPFYLKKIAGITGTKQILFCTITFVVWVFSMGGPLKDVMIWDYSTQFLGAVFLPIYTLIIPIFYNKP
jgi:hypothetical protein